MSLLVAGYAGIGVVWALLATLGERWKALVEKADGSVLAIGAAFVLAAAFWPISLVAGAILYVFGEEA